MTLQKTNSSATALPRGGRVLVKFIDGDQTPSSPRDKKGPRVSSSNKTERITLSTGWQQPSTAYGAENDNLRAPACLQGLGPLLVPSLHSPYTSALCHLRVENTEQTLGHEGDRGPGLSQDINLVMKSRSQRSRNVDRESGPEQWG